MCLPKCAVYACKWWQYYRFVFGPVWVSTGVDLFFGLLFVRDRYKETTPPSENFYCTGTAAGLMCQHNLYLVTICCQEFKSKGAKPEENGK